jgi:hypothetical protein
MRVKQPRLLSDVLFSGKKGAGDYVGTKGANTYGDYLTGEAMNYQPLGLGKSLNPTTGTKKAVDTMPGTDRKVKGGEGIGTVFGMNPFEASAAITAGYGLLGSLFPKLRGEVDFNVTAPDEGMKITGDEATRMTQDIMNKINRGAGADRAGILSTRAPAGAKLASMRGLGADVASRRGDVASEVERMQQQAEQAYERERMQYEMARQAAEAANARNRAEFFGGILGGLGKSLLLNALVPGSSVLVK